ncbi:hypothetical protein [Roseovarius sp.]|uniref:hypothetical protein n=1 Tax=Roseovarius sp. TaxID=1486281 RepID=UPI003BACA5E6
MTVICGIPQMESGNGCHPERIRARATRRAGELLKQVEPSKGGRPISETKDGADPSFSTSRKSAAADAGFSERQAKTAQRLANIPEHDFEKMVEADTTITKMAEAGTC